MTFSKNEGGLGKYFQGFRSASAGAGRWTRPMVLLVALFALYFFAYFTIYFSNSLKPGGAPVFGDFFAFWSFSRFSQEVKSGNIYDVAGLMAFQRNLPGGFQDFYPFPYPPIFLVFIQPLGWFSYLSASLIWLGMTISAYVASVYENDMRSFRLWLAIFAPATIFAIISGQNGFLAAALMIGGFRLLSRQPFTAGMVLGCLSFKPQLVVLVPVVLLAVGQWRAIFGISASVTLLIAISAALFGPEIWLQWFFGIPEFVRLFEDNLPKLGPLMPTVTVAALANGLSRAATNLLQLTVACGVVGALCLMFRKGARMGSLPRQLDVAALVVGVFVATPYAFIYDMPMMTYAIATLITVCQKDNRPWLPGELLVVLAALVLPILQYSQIAPGVPIGPVTLLLLFALIVRVGWNRKS